MAVKYYSGSPISGKEMDGFTFVFEAVDVVSGSWRGIYKTDEAAQLVALAKLASDGQIKEINQEVYDSFLKKKEARQRISPQMNAVSEQQGVGLAEAQAPKESIEDESDVLEVQQVAKPQGKKQGRKKK